MWQEAKFNEKKIKEVMADHKKRAERRRAYYNSKLGDPRQLLRIIGSNVKLYPNGEQYYYHENTNNLMPWQGDTTIRIDRFDGRSLLDIIPEKSFGKGALDDEDFSDREELNFERYRDLLEADRLHLTEKERLELVDDEWIKILDRHKEMLSLINPQKKKSNAIGYDYGSSTTTTTDKQADETESDLLNETDILKYINELTEGDRQTLNDMGRKYGIRNYTRLLRVAKRDRDEALKQLQAKQQNRGSNNKTESKKAKRRKRKRSSRWNTGAESRHRRRRGSPSYGNESGSDDDDDDDDTDASDDDSNSSGNDEKSDFVIEFGSTSGVDDQQQRKQPVKSGVQDQSSGAKDRHTILVVTGKASGTITEKKLTPMEKLKMKMRAGLEKTIQSDESAKLQKEQERQLDDIEQYAKEHQSFGGDTLGPLVTSLHAPSVSTQPTKPTRYRSPSSSRSPSPTSKRMSPPPSRRDDRRRSPSPKRRSKDSHHRYRSPSRSSTSTQDSRHRKSSSSSYRESSHKRSRSRSRSPSRRRHHRHSRRSRSPPTKSKEHRYSAR
ncbi:unnamed protein product [Absidia cylindrospora]